MLDIGFGQSCSYIYFFVWILNGCQQRAKEMCLSLSLPALHGSGLGAGPPHQLIWLDGVVLDFYPKDFKHAK